MYGSPARGLIKLRSTCLLRRSGPHIRARSVPWAAAAPPRGPVPSRAPPLQATHSTAKYPCMHVSLQPRRLLLYGALVPILAVAVPSLPPAFRSHRPQYHCACSAPRVGCYRQPFIPVLQDRPLLSVAPSSSCEVSPRLPPPCTLPLLTRDGHLIIPGGRPTGEATSAPPLGAPSRFRVDFSAAAAAIDLAAAAAAAAPPPRPPGASNSLPASIRRQDAVAVGAAVTNRVCSNPVCMPRGVQRDGGGAGGGGTAASGTHAVLSAPSASSSRSVTAYLQQTGMEDGKGIRAVIRALQSAATDSGGGGGGTASSGSNAIAALCAAGGAAAAATAAARLPSGSGAALSQLRHISAGSGSQPAGVTAASRVGVGGRAGGAADPTAPEAGSLAAAATATVGTGTDAANRCAAPVVPPAAAAAARLERWHEVHVKPCFDPMSSEPLTMVGGWVG
jgi:hypothetical protein